MYVQVSRENFNAFLISFGPSFSQAYERAQAVSSTRAASLDSLSVEVLYVVSGLHARWDDRTLVLQL